MATPVRQLLSQTSYNGTGSNTVWDFTFAGGYLQQSHVKASRLNKLTGIVTQIPLTPANFIGPYQISITPALPATAELTIYRDTPKDQPIVNFADRAALTEAALDINAKQSIFVAAESSDGLATAIDSVAQIANYTQLSSDYAASALASRNISTGAAATASSDAASAASNAGIATAKAAQAVGAASGVTASAGAALASQNAAANSAAAAAAVEASVIAARNTATTAASQAQGSAVSASGSATAAANSASSMSGSVTAAANSASSANSAANVASNAAVSAANSAASFNTSNLVNRTDNQTVAGVKTFTTNVYAPAFQAVGGSPGLEMHIPGVGARFLYLANDGVTRLVTSTGNFGGIGVLMAIDAGGNLTMQGNVTAFSDSRLKTNLKPIGLALDKVCYLNGYTYDRIATGRREVGLIAQELRDVLPEAVFGDEAEGVLSVAYGNVVALLVEAIKELRSEVNSLKGL